MNHSATAHEPPKRTRRRKRRVNAARGRRGIALLMALTASVLLFLLSQQVRDEQVLYSSAAAVARDQVIAEYQARSMVNLARLVLHAEPTIRRALTPVLAPMMAVMGRGLTVPQIPLWEQADLLLGAFRNQQGAADFSQAVGIDMGAARGLGGLTGASPVVIVDEDSKINVNGLDRGPHIQRRLATQLMALLAPPALEPYFTEVDPDGQRTDRISLVSALIDYGDENLDTYDVQSQLSSNAGASANAGPEDTFYGALRPPYARRNAPFDSVEELRMVRGLGSDDLWSAIVDRDPGEPRQRTLTVWGQGLINVNTANPDTILALICVHAPTAPPCGLDVQARASFLMGLSMLQSFTSRMGLPMFTTPRSFVDTVTGRPPMGTMLAGLGVQPFQLTDPTALENSVTTESKVFSIYGEAAVGQAHVRIHCVVDMRAQPGIPGSFTQFWSGTLTRSQSAGAQVITTSSGNIATVATAGGTVLYWRED